jgi:hypothetical protein
MGIKKHDFGALVGAWCLGASLDGWTGAIVVTILSVVLLANLKDHEAHKELKRAVCWAATSRRDNDEARVKEEVSALLRAYRGGVVDGG